MATSHSSANLCNASRRCGNPTTPAAVASCSLGWLRRETDQATAAAFPLALLPKNCLTSRPGFAALNR